MAVSKNDVLAFISQYAVENKRKAPRKAIIDALGTEAASVIESMKKDGTITASRGRTGGLSVSSTVTAEVSEVTETTDAEIATPAATADDDVASQFALLMEKLESEPEQAVAV